MASISRPLTGQALEETEIPSVYPAEEPQFNMPRSAKNRSKSAQRQKPNLLKDNAWPDLAKVNSSVENRRESLPQGEQLEEQAMAAPCAARDNIGPSESIVHELDEEMNVSCPALIFESFDALCVAEKADLHSLSEAYASAFLERAESLNQAPLSYKTLPLKPGQIDAGDHQQMESTVGLWSREKAMLFKKDPMPETLNPDQLVGSMRKKTHSTSLNDRHEMRRPVVFQGSTTKTLQKEFIVEVEHSNKVAAANAESIQAMRHTAISSLAHYRRPNHPQHQLNYLIDSIAPSSAGFQSMINALVDQSSSCNDFVNSNPPGHYDLDGVGHPCNCFIDGNPLGYVYNLDGQPCSKTNSVNHSPKFGLTVTSTDLNSRGYTGHLYGLSAAERSFVSPPSKQLHDQSLAISSDSATLSFGTESSPSPYSSPGSPYEGRAHVHASQYAGTGCIPRTSSNTSFWPTKSASAHSLSNLVGTSSPDSVPYFQLEDDVLIMDGVLVESQRPLQHACTDSQQRAGKSIPEIGFLGSPSFLPWEHSGSVHFPDARSRQYIAKELGPDDRLLHRGHSEGYFSGDSTDSSSTTPSKMKLESLSKTIKGSRSGASSEGTSNAKKCSIARHVNQHEPPEYSPELVRALNLPENLDFLYEIPPEDTTSSTAEQYESSSPSQSISSFSSLSESAPMFSSKTTPSSCMKEMESTPQSCPPTNMIVPAPKFSATSPARSSPPLHKHDIEAPPFMPAKRTSLCSTEAETAQSPVKGSPFLAKTVVALQADPRTPEKSTSPPFTGDSSSQKSVTRAAPRTPAKSSTQPAQSPAPRSPSLPKSAAKASPYTPVKGRRLTHSKVSSTPTTIMASPAKRPPPYPKTMTPPPSPAKYSSS